MTRPNDILAFWFQNIDDQTTIPKKNPPASRWFAKDKQFDDEIRNKFSADLERAGEGEYRDWEGFARGRLALVLLFDQFSRNIYRDTPTMFAHDALALDLTMRSIHEKKDRELPLIYRIFFYMPLMHAEDGSMQELSVQCFLSVVEESKTICPYNTSYFEYNWSYAKQHRDIIARFGRFPHRNKILARPSTDEEKIFLLGSKGSF